MPNNYNNFTNLFRENVLEHSVDFMNEGYSVDKINSLLCETQSDKASSFFTYLTALGSVPIVHIYKDDFKNFIENMENKKDCEINFITDPLYNSPNDPKCCSSFVCKNNKFYFMEYEDGHSAFCAYYVDTTSEIIDRLKIIYNKIPNDIDNVLKLL